MKGEDRTKEEAVHAPPEPKSPTPRRQDDTMAALFEEHHERVYRVARRITGSAEDAEDVLQTVFLRLVRREGDGPDADDPTRYLHRAATNASLDLLRRRAAARLEPIARADQVRDRTPGPDRRHDGEQLKKRLREALAGLSPRAAEIFVLRHFDGLGNREIARILNTSWSTVAVTLHRTRAKLQKDLKGDLR